MKKSSGNNAILDELTFIREQGFLSFRGIRYLLIRPETAISLYKEIEKKFGWEAGSEIFFHAGLSGGKIISEKFRCSCPGWETEILEFMASMGSDIGWGRFAIKEIDLTGKKLILTIHSSPFAESYGKSLHPVCDLPRGVFSGAAAGIFGPEIEAVETRCRAMGSKSCRIEIQGKKK